MKRTNIFNIFFYSIISIELLIDTIYPFFPGVRFFRYIGIPLFFILLLKKRNISSYKVNDRAKPFIFLILFSLITFFLLSEQGIIELIIIFAGISMFIFKYDFDIKVNSLNTWAIFLFVVLYSWRAKYNFSVESLVASDTSSVEGGYSFIFGLFALYYWEEKKYKRLLLNMVIMALSLKRITLIALLLVILVNLLPGRFKKIIKNKYFIISINIFFIAIIHLFVTGYFDALIKQTTGGASVGMFTGGRNTLYSLVLDKKYFSDFDYIIGIGQGRATNILKAYFGHVFLLHNDILKIVVEHGYLGLLIFLLLFYKTDNEKIFDLCLYVNVLYLTDNTLIYPIVYALYFLFAYLFEKETNQEKIPI